MRMPKFSNLLLVAVGLFILSSVSIAPNGTRKPVVMADGTVAHGPDGRVLTEFDSSGFLKGNWFDLSAAVLSLVFLVLAVARLIWPRVRRDMRSHK
jgi:hypothetical protein